MTPPLSEPDRGRRRWPLAALVALLVLAAGITIGVVIGGGDDNNAAPAGPTAITGPSPAAGGTPGPTPSASTGSGTPLPAVLPTVPLNDLRWADYHGLALPISASGGPRQAGELASGFAHSPLGALLAAIHITSRTEDLLGTNIYGPTIERQVIGPDKDALRSNADADYRQDRVTAGGTLPPGAPAGQAHTRLVAFRFEGYTPNVATVHFAGAGPGEGGVQVMIDFRAEARWSGTDWQVVAPPGGDWNNAATQVDAATLATYTQFPAH
jgi:hypothetical protein